MLKNYRSKWKKRFEKQLFSIAFVSSVLTFYFILAYLLGATRIAKNNFLGYLIVGIVCFVFTLIVYFIRHKRKRRGRFSYYSIIIIVSSFLFGIVEFYILNHLALYWIILTLLLIAILSNIYVFFRTLKNIIPGKKLDYGKAIWSLSVVFLNLLFGIAFFYLIYERYYDEKLFIIQNKTNEFLDYLYFSVVTMTAVGFGDILPRSPLAKFLTLFQALLGYFIFSVIVGLVLLMMRKKG